MQAVVRSRKSVLAGAVQAALAAGLLLHGGTAIAQYDEGGYDSSGTSSVQGAPAGEGSMGATQVAPADAGQGSDAGASGTYGQDSVQGQDALQVGSRSRMYMRLYRMGMKAMVPRQTVSGTSV